jgi:hypothetical protein
MSLPQIFTSTVQQLDPQGTLFASGGTPPGNTSLPFNMQSQQQNYWCWAAVAVSISHFYDANSLWTQCSLVNDVFKSIMDCCKNGRTASCDRVGRLDTPLRLTGNLSSMSPGPVPLSGIDSEIGNGRPLACRIVWRDGVGHFVVLQGTKQSYGSPTMNSVEVKDPKFGSSTYSYGSFSKNYQNLGGTWKHSYYTQP